MEEKIILDGKEISEEQLKEAMNNKQVKVIEESKGVYKTLQKLQS